MPRRRAAPRLYLDPKRRTWIIRDGASFLRTGCIEGDRQGAEVQLADYIRAKYKPTPSPSPLIADVLLAYAKYHLPQTRTARDAAYHIKALAAWWGDKRTSDVTSRNCIAYASNHTPASARRSLEALRAALNYWHKEYSPLTPLPSVRLPPKAEPRERWLTRNEVACLLWVARHTSHVARFILLGIYTGSRSQALLSAEWSWIDLKSGVMRRRAVGTTETKKRTPPVRLGSRVLSHLRRWHRLDGPHSKFIIHYHGRRLRTMRGAWSKARDQAGLDADVTPHSLRRTTATWLLQSGIGVWEASGFLGMSVTVLTKSYAKHHPTFQQQAAEALSRKR
jgi:integrase